MRVNFTDVLSDVLPDVLPDVVPDVLPDIPPDVLPDVLPEKALDAFKSKISPLRFGFTKRKVWR